MNLVKNNLGVLSMILIFFCIGFFKDCARLYIDLVKNNLVFSSTTDIFLLLVFLQDYARFLGSFQEQYWVYKYNLNTLLLQGSYKIMQD